MDDFFTHWEASDSNPFLSIQGGKNNNKHIEEKIKLTMVHFNKDDDMDNV
jgi:hypothetical protein